MTADLATRLRDAANHDGDECEWPALPALLHEAADEIDSLTVRLHAAEKFVDHDMKRMEERFAAAERVIVLLKEWDLLEAQARSGDASEVMDKVWAEVDRFEKAYSGGVDINVALALGVSTSADLYSLKQTAETYKSSGEMKGSDNAADLNSAKEESNG